MTSPPTTSTSSAMKANPEPSPDGYVVRAIEVPPATARPAGPTPGASDLASETS